MTQQWTRDDLPSLPDVLGEVTTHECGEGAAAYRTAALAHLNAHHPKPSDDLYSMVLSQAGHVHDLKADLADMTRERDAAVARAEQAENARDIVATRAGQLEKRLAKVMSDYQDIEDELDEWKARAKEAFEQGATWHKQSVPAVSRADIEKALDTGIRGTTDGGLIDQDTSIPSGECVRLAVDAVCDLLGIEAEQATDPVEVLADDFAQALAGDEHIGGSWSMDPSDWRDITLALAKRAKDVLGQEASDE